MSSKNFDFGPAPIKITNGSSNSCFVKHLQSAHNHYYFELILYLINVQKRNKEVETEVLDWISKVLGEPLPPGEFENILKDGVVLCNLMNKLAPGSVKKIATKGTNFQLMENIQRFQAGMKAYGVPQEEIFQTADLFEKRNIAQVYWH